MRLWRQGSAVVRAALVAALALGLAACGTRPEPVEPVFEAPPHDEGYGPIEDSGYVLPAVEQVYTAGVNRRALVPWTDIDPPGSIVVDPFAKFLFYVLPDGTAMRYPIAVGREGRGLKGETVIRRKEIWPGWQPTANMLRTEPELYAQFAGGVEGGLSSPLGARALYLYRGGRDTYFRIHGTNDLPSIGHNSSAGCIRLFNHDVIDLFDRVELGTNVRIRTLEQSVEFEGEAMAHRGDDVAPSVTSLDGSTPPRIEDQGTGAPGEAVAGLPQEEPFNPGGI